MTANGVTASLPRATVGKELLKKRFAAEVVFKKKIGLPRADHQALGKEADLSRALLSAKSPESIFLFLFIFPASTTHISQI